MRLTRETEYALRGLSLLARRPKGAAVVLREVARAEGLPSSFLKKIFQKLTRHGILRSSRGPGHGYALAAPPGAISLMDIVEAVQGPDYLERCVFWSGRCGASDPCVLHDRWLSVKPHVLALLENTTLADLAPRFPRRRSLAPGSQTVGGEGKPKKGGRPCRSVGVSS